MPQWLRDPAPRSGSRTPAKEEMFMYDSFLFDLGWLFFAAWGSMVAVVTISAFRQELFPGSPQPEQSTAVRKVSAPSLD